MKTETGRGGQKEERRVEKNEELDKDGGGKEETLG